MAYFVLSALTAALGSGWLVTSMELPANGAWAHALNWLFAVCVLVTAWTGIAGSRRWLGFPWRGPALDRGMHALQQALAACTALVCLAMGLDLLGLLPLARYLWAVTWLAGGLAVLALLLCSYVCYRMAQLSDRLSLWLAWATVLTVPGICMLVASRADGAQPAPWVWALLSAMHGLAMLCTAHAAVQQDALHNARHRAEADASNFNALDRAALGERLGEIFAPKFDRLHESGVAPALIVVNVFNHDDVLAAHGVSAADQVTLATLARLRNVLNPHDLVARYFDACFVILIRAQVDTHYLREVCLRVASSVRRDVALRGTTALQNDHAPVALEVGVGLCWSDRVSQFSEALTQAGAASTAARYEASKASVVLYPGKPAVPVEAVLGGEERATPGSVL